MRGLLDWWLDLSPWWRRGIAGFFILISTAMLLCGTFWRLGWVLGVVLMIFSGFDDECCK